MRDAMVSIVYVRTLHKAADLAGGRRKLARQLRVPLAELDRWMAGDEAPPIATFLKAVDLVLDETGAPRESDAGDPPAPRDCAPGGGAWLC
jgi:hypothetical protein